MKFKTQNLKIKTIIQNSKILRILDVNLNRATEGLRVVEEICRFILEDKELTLKVKQLRGELRIDRKLYARQALSDVGRELYSETEGKRQGIEDIFKANIKRAQEAIRCLEEFSKLINKQMGNKFKQIRFKLYELEKIITLRLEKYLMLDFDLYVVTDPMRNHVEAAREAVAGGVRIVQLRDKKASKAQILKWAGKMRKMVPIFIVNDYADIARKVKADGVHLGQEDLRTISIDKVRKLLGKGKIIGISTHSLLQAIHAEKIGADYISLGPIFATMSKPGIRPLGLTLLGKVVKRVKIPVIAIGGINEFNIHNVIKAGCQRAAVIRAVLDSKNIKRAVKQIREEMLR